MKEPLRLAPQIVAFALGVVSISGWLFLNLTRFDGGISQAAEWSVSLAILATLCYVGAILFTFQSYQRTIEELRRQSAQEKEALSRTAEMGEWTLELLHELKTPLATLDVSLQMLARTRDPEEREALIRDTREELRFAQQVIEGFQSLSRADFVRKHPLALGAVIEDALKRNAAEIARKGIRVDRALEAQGTVEGNRELLGLVLHNLVLNALEAMEAGGTLSIGTRAGADAGAPAVEITVRDTGKGIPPEVRERLFQPFLTTKAQGRGMGLLVARRIAQAHRGSLALARSGPEGTAFQVRLPLLRSGEA